MAVRVGINGFGRIGRITFRAMEERYGDSIEVVAVNDLVDPETNALLLKHDSNYGAFPRTVEASKDAITVDGREIKVFQARNPVEIPWKDLGVQVVVESSGVFTDGNKAKAHLEAGAERVIISAPASNEDITVVMGVNHTQYDPANHRIISNASCTTNCLAPVGKVLLERFGIVKGLMTTVHAATNDQKVADQAHKDPRRARSTLGNIIPTSTGAAKAISLVLPQLKNKMHGISFRVPTATVSVIDLVVELERATTAEEINAALEEYAGGEMKGILGVTREELVSKDFQQDSRSSIVDAQTTMVMEGNMAKIVSWYDNEWGYSCRVADLCNYITQ